MNFSMLARVVDELNSLLPGALIERVLEGEGRSIVLDLHAGRRRLLLLLSPDRTMPRLHLVSVKPPARAVAHPFALFLKSRIGGGRIEGIKLLNSDRLVEFDIVRRDAAYRLYFEVFGPAANLVLTDSNGRILAVYYPVPLSDKQARPLLPGLQYTAPTRRRQPEPAAPLQSVLPDSDTSANRSAEQELDRARSGSLLTTRRSQLASTIKKERERVERRQTALLKDRANADRAEELKEAGDLILANLASLRQGMERAELAGHEGAGRVVLLDPKRTPVRNAELYFKRYKKAKAGQAIIAARLSETESLLAFLKECQDNLERSHDADDLENVEAVLRIRGLVKSAGGERQAAAGQPDALPLRRVLFQGWEILVGKNAAGNDYLSTRLARPSDVWFHAEGMPGSHVLIRNPGERDVPDEVVLKAAGLAAFYSKGRLAGKVAVTFSLSRHVKKPKGAKPGMVTVSERRTIMAVPQGE